MVSHRKSNLCVYVLLNVLIPMTISWTPLRIDCPPKLMIFDLDVLVSPFWKTESIKPPLKLLDDGQIVDANAAKFKACDDVPDILDGLQKVGQMLAVVGRMGEEVLDVYNWTKYFNYTEIYPGSKIAHIVKLTLKTHNDYKDLLYFGMEGSDIDYIEQSTTTYVYAVNKKIDKNMVVRGLGYYEMRSIT